MHRRLIRFTCWLLIFALFASPVLAEFGQPSLLGLETAGRPAVRPVPPAPVLGAGPEAPPPAPPPPRLEPAGGGAWTWMRDFGAGALHGFLHALPELVRSFRDAPLRTSLTVGGMIALGLVWPPGALIAGAGMMGHAAWQAGLDARKLGSLVGETALWFGAGAAAARGVKRLRGARAAAEAEAGTAALTEGTASPKVKAVEPAPPAKPTTIASLFENQKKSSLPEWTGAGEMPYRTSYRQILSTFEDPAKSAKLAGMLEAEVAQVAATQNISRQAALEQILARREQAGGFKPAIELENRVYSDAEFHAMLERGALFRDRIFTGGNHGAQTHRVQWNLIMRDMELNPQLYRLPDGSMPRPVDLYTTMGAGSFTSRVNGGATMWGTLFDSFNGNFTHPEFLNTTAASKWPGIALW